MDMNIDEVGSSLTHQLIASCIYFAHLFIHLLIYIIHPRVSPICVGHFRLGSFLVMASMFGEGRKTFPKRGI
jgi:hypothetical protein